MNNTSHSIDWWEILTKQSINWCFISFIVSAVSLKISLEILPRSEVKQFDSQLYPSTFTPTKNPLCEEYIAICIPQSGKD